MGNYRVLLHAHNLWLEFEGKIQLGGFYVTRFVEAASTAEAGLRALAQVREEGHLRSARNRRGDPPHVDVSETCSVVRDDVPRVPPGYALYLAEESEVT
jgi:hypothetical protein